MQSVKNGQSSVLSVAKKKLGHSIEVTGQFSLVTNAIAATVSYGDMETLSKLPGVKKVFLSPCYSVPGDQCRGDGRLSDQHEHEFAGRR